MFVFSGGCSEYIHVAAVFEFEALAQFGYGEREVACGDIGFLDAMSASALADGLKMSSHAADAAQAVFSENFHNFRMGLNGFNNAGIFSNHYAFLL